DRAVKNAAAGDEVDLFYKPPESHGPAPDRKATLKLLAPPVRDVKYADPFLTPDFPGITDKDDIGAWDLPFEDPDWTKSISREYGDAYWKKYRGAPKAFVTLQKAKELWGSARFGSATSVRLALPGTGNSGDVFEDVAQRYRAALLKRLTPESG